jgi:hypothetical protein
MNWALEHLQLAIVIVVVVGGLIKKMSAAVQRGAKNPPRTQTQASASSQKRSFDTEAAERTRRIQDEIRKKIEERRRALAQPTERPPELKTPEYDPFAPEALQRRNPQEVPRPPEPPRMSSERAIMIAQRLEAAKQREEKRKSKKSAARDDTISIQVAPIELIPSAGPLLPVHPLRETLTNPDEVRRAIVLSEILQPPVALR